MFFFFFCLIIIDQNYSYKHLVYLTLNMLQPQTTIVKTLRLFRNIVLLAMNDEFVFNKSNFK